MKYLNRKSALMILAIGAGLHSSAYAQDINAVLSEWSVVTSGNLDLVSDIQGRAYIGGNVVVPQSFNTATVGGSAIGVNDISLAVGGYINAGGDLHINGGSVVAGGAIISNVIMNSHGTETENEPSALPPSPIAQITSASQYWSTLAANSTASPGYTSGQQGPYNFNCAANASVAVFNVSARALFNVNNQIFTLDPSQATKDVIINVEGSSINWNSGHFASQFNTPQWDGHVLFNFYDATSVNLSNDSIGGYIVAPNADVTEDHNIDGGVMAKNLTVESEVDLPTNNDPSAWSGDLPNAPVPEASTGFFGVGALVMASGLLFSEKRNRLQISVKG
jgi:choice-of-anchor A domain-containing protein